MVNITLPPIHNVPNKTIPLRKVVDFFHSYNLVGEEKNILMQTLATIYKIPYGIVSLSGSGKSYATDILYKRLINPKKTFIVGHSTQTALIYSAPIINMKKHLYVEELQKLLQTGNIAVELMKNVMEGKAYTRPKTDIMTNSTIDMKINPIHSVFTLAIENSSKEDDEMSRRHFTIPTDISKDQTARVINMKCKRRFKKERLRKIKTEDEKDLYTFINWIDDQPKGNYENPMSEYFAKILESDYIRVRSLIDYYFDLMEASAKWYQLDRLKTEDGKILVDVQDVFLAHKLYGEMFHQNVLQIPLLGQEILNVFDSAKGVHKKESQRSLIQYEDEEEIKAKMLTVAQIHRELKKKKHTIKHNVITQACDVLCEGNYLEKEKMGSSVYYTKRFDIESFVDKVDFVKVFEEGYKNMLEHYPNLSEKWRNRQLLRKEGSDGLNLENPISNSQIWIDIYQKNVTEFSKDKLDNTSLTEDRVEDKDKVEVEKISISSNKKEEDPDIIMKAINIVLDSGEELNREDIIESYGEEYMKYIEKLLKEGILFEPKKGVFKKLQ